MGIWRLGVQMLRTVHTGAKTASANTRSACIIWGATMDKEVLANILNEMRNIQHLLVQMDAKIGEIAERMDFEEQQMCEKIYGVKKIAIDEFEEFAERSR